MDKEKLREKRSMLLVQADQFSYEDLPKGSDGYLNRVPPEFSTWYQNVRNAIKQSYKKGSWNLGTLFSFTVSK